MSRKTLSIEADLERRARQATVCEPHGAALKYKSDVNREEGRSDAGLMSRETSGSSPSNNRPMAALTLLHFFFTS